MKTSQTNFLKVSAVVLTCSALALAAAAEEYKPVSAPQTTSNAKPCCTAKAAVSETALPERQGGGKPCCGIGGLASPVSTPEQGRVGLSCCGGADMANAQIFTLGDGGFALSGDGAAAGPFSVIFSVEDGHGSFATSMPCFMGDALAVSGNGAFSPVLSADGTVFPATAAAFSGMAADSTGSGAWLGVQLGQVDDALSTHLSLEGKGLTILNVVEGSPAESAGLQKNDVIVGMNGEGVEGGVAAFAQRIQTLDPGANVTLSIIRAGKRLEVNAVLGERRQDFTWKFPFAPDARIEDHMTLKGSVLRPGENGEWTLEQLGDLSQLQGLPQEDPGQLQGATSMTSQLLVDDGSSTVKIEVNNNGSILSVSKSQDGKITVSRTTPGGDQTSNEYADMDQLKAADEEAYKLLSGRGVHFFHLPGGIGQLQIITPDGKDLGDLQAALELQLGDIEERTQEALKKVEEFWSDGPGEFQLFLTDPTGQAPAVGQAHGHLLQPGTGDGKGGALFSGSLLRKAGRTITVRPDGVIEIRSRKGDDELIREYRNADDLHHRDPELYDTYQELLEVKD